jgi:hypothetical protein
VDEVLQFAGEELFQRENGDFHVAQDHYLQVGEYLRIIEDDSSLQQSSLERAGIPKHVTDPITDLQRHFLAELGPKELAAELRVSESALREAAGRLPEPLQGVARGSLQSVPRDVVSAAYHDALCALHASSTHPPQDCAGD